MQIKPRSKLSDCPLRFRKASESAAGHHHLQHEHKLIGVSPQGQQAFVHEYFVIIEHLRIQPSKYLDHLKSQLERGGFEIDASRGISQEKPEIYMNNMSF